jgi:hypothetical protein
MAALGSPARPAPAVLTTSDAFTEMQELEDEFTYDDGFDAGVADRGALARAPIQYTGYSNPRFGFHLEVPTVFRPMPDPDTGDGRQWRLGHLVAVTASGMYVPSDDYYPACANSPHVTAHQGSKLACFATGKLNGFVHWERQVVARGVMFSLRVEYVEELKSAMDPIVAHVNASWGH